MNKYLLIISMVLSFFLKGICQTTSSGPTYGGIRPLNEINTNLNESYPYISGNGLNLYFLQGSGNNNSLKVSLRTSIGSNYGTATSRFTSPTSLKILDANYIAQEINGVQGYYLSKGELEIVYGATTAVGVYNFYIATRANNLTTTTFNRGVNIVLSGFSLPANSHLTAPSITPNSTTTTRELYFLYIDASDKKSIIKFIQASIGSLTYNYCCSTSPPNGFEFGSSQLSGDGQRFYLSMLGSNESKFYFIPKSLLIPGTLGLSSFFPLSGEVCNGIQPSTSTHGNTYQDLVFVVNPTIFNLEQIWYQSPRISIAELNNLYITSFSSTTAFPIAREEAIEVTIKTNQFYLSDPYPNPSDGNFTVDYSLPENIDNAILKLYSLEGIELQRLNLNSAQNTISFKNLAFASGIYFYSVAYSNNIITKKIIIIK